MINLILIILLAILLLGNVAETFYGYQAPYFRSQAYQNVCEPDYGGLLRVKRTTQDNCLRTLDDAVPVQKPMECYYDEFMRKNCFFKQ
jgi:hypothetical protein